MDNAPDYNKICHTASGTTTFEICILELQLTKVIGAGGFGTVHSGTWRGNVVAIKEIKKTNMSKSSRKNIQNEQKIHLRLKHENVITLYGFINSSEKVLLVMEHAAGDTLRSVLRGKGPLNNKSVLVNWALQIARGMRYLHRMDIVHRDLKSTNVLIMDQILSKDAYVATTLKISDLGFAIELKKTMYVPPAGTGTYLAPEVYNKKEFSRKSDVWSYGIVLWELLTGQKPHEGMTTSELAVKVGKDGFHPPIPQTCVGTIRELLTKCWKHCHTERYLFEDIVDILKTEQKSIPLRNPSAKIQKTTVGPTRNEQHSAETNVGRSVQDSSSSANISTKPLVGPTRNEQHCAETNVGRSVQDSSSSSNISTKPLVGLTTSEQHSSETNVGWSVQDYSSAAAISKNALVGHTADEQHSAEMTSARPAQKDTMSTSISTEALVELTTGEQHSVEANIARSAQGDSWSTNISTKALAEKDYEILKLKEQSAYLRDELEKQIQTVKRHLSELTNKTQQLDAKQKELEKLNGENILLKSQLDYHRRKMHQHQ